MAGTFGDDGLLSGEGFLPPSQFLVPECEVPVAPDDQRRQWGKFGQSGLDLGEKRAAGGDLAREDRGGFTASWTVEGLLIVGRALVLGLSAGVPHSTMSSRSSKSTVRYPLCETSSTRPSPLSNSPVKPSTTPSTPSALVRAPTDSTAFRGAHRHGDRPRRRARIRRAELAHPLSRQVSTSLSDVRS